MKKKNKKKIRIRSLLFIILFIYLIGSFGYYLFTLPIKNIYILGTNLIEDQEIIDIAGLKKYPSLFKINKSKIAKNVKKLELVDDVKVSRNIFGKVTIEVREAKPLFYYRSNDVIYLSNGKTIEDKQKYLGIPVVINYVPSDILDDLIKRFSDLNNNIIGEISEIEYSPDEKNGTILDENRFIFRMSDTNIVYIDTINLEKLNSYQKICATLEEGVHGYIYLNSNRDNASFKAYETKETEDLGSE
ncbi:MAG: FtsQ-type POTRA domain-containing protein [Bacilli bacterium]|nr:FtsQ-type POTRA domain-containing protein [Bacilli bacterium]